jgi:cytoskeletal protein RodZ
LRNFFGRLGMVGAFVILAALVFGVLAGGVIVHRLETNPASSQQQHGEAQDQKDKQDNQDNQDKTRPTSKPSKKPHPAESPDPQEND